MARPHPVRRFTEAWRRLAPLIGAHPRRLTALAVRSVLAGFLEAATLVVLVQIAFTMANDEADVELGLGPLGTVTLTLGQLFAVAVVLGVGRLVAQVADARLSSSMSTDALVRLRRDVTAAFESASWPRQAEEREGRFQEVVSNHTAQVATAVLVVAGALSGAFNLGALLVSAVLVDALAATTIVVGVTALFFLLRPLARRSRATSEAYGRLAVELGQETNDLVRLSQEIKVHDVGAERAEAVGATIDAAGREFYRINLLGRSVPAVYQALAMVLIVATLAVVAAVDVANIRALGAIVLMLVRALSYGQGLQSAYQRIGDLLPYADALRALLDGLRAAAIPREGAPLDRIDEVRFDRVAFRYGEGRAALHDVSFSLARGECLGVIGPSGAGKSTLIQVLLGLRPPSEGRVEVNGTAQADLAVGDWRRRVGFVPQDPQLVEGTVAENIAFFRPGIGPDEVESAARAAHLHDEIAALPQGYDTPIGPRHQTVSGGQRQRLCLARALVTGPDLLVLDEPTSALDLRSEHLVHQSLGELAEERLVVVIAHRLSTLSICDRIMVLEDGEVRGLLPADELAEENAFFREVVALAGLR